MKLTAAEKQQIKDRAEQEGGFGLCYLCDDYDDHENCIGVPCQCPCSPPDERVRAAQRQQVLDQLTPLQRQILGV